MNVKEDIKKGVELDLIPFEVGLKNTAQYFCVRFEKNHNMFFFKASFSGSVGSIKNLK